MWWIIGTLLGIATADKHVTRPPKRSSTVAVITAAVVLAVILVWLALQFWINGFFSP